MLGSQEEENYADDDDEYFDEIRVGIKYVVVVNVVVG